MGDLSVNLPVDTTDMINDVAKQEKFTDFVVSGEIASSTGDNFLGLIYRVSIEEKSNAKKKISLILKYPGSVELRAVMPINFFYKKELYAYSKVLPTFCKLQEECGIKAEDRIRYAKFYRGVDEDLKEFIIMEDLREDGYRLYDRLQPMDYQHVCVVVKNLALLHAASFAMKSKHPERFKQLSEGVAHGMQYGDGFGVFLRDTTSKIADHMVEEDLKQILKKLSLDIGDRLRDILDQKTADEYSVICHGDCWSNNIMFKYEGASPVGVCLVDWQITRLASPVTDLAYLVFGCTEQSFRARHLQEMKTLYYQSLGRSLQQLGERVDQCYPKEVYDRHFQQFLPLGLFMSMAIIPMTQAKRGEGSSLEDAMGGPGAEDQQPAGLRLTDQGVERLRGITRDFIGYGML